MFKIGICIALVALLIISAFPQINSKTTCFYNSKKLYSGPKIIFDEANDKKGNPHGDPPGQGKPPKDDGPQPDPSIDKWAIIIGISDYRGKMNDLNYCDDDALEIYNYLISRNYPEGNIKLLIDGDAKAKNIYSAIDWLNSWEGVDSEVFFFFSGHGTTYDGDYDSDGEYTDEAIVAADLQSILDGQLKDKFADFSSQKMTFTFDICYAGGMNDLNGLGRVISMACNEEEYSREYHALQNGVFTYYFIEGLAIYNNVEDAHSYAKTEVINYTGDNQHPQISDNYLGNWLL